jgi:hypothetical protein
MKHLLVPMLTALLIVSMLWAGTIVMIVAAFQRNDSLLVGASAMCFIAASLLLVFVVAALKAYKAGD